MDTIFSAVVIGGLLTTLPPRDYFTSHGFFEYFLNIVGDIHFYLPGVFEQNPWQRVNQSLWTLPSELKCYALITFLIVLRILVRPRLTLWLSIAAIGAFVIYQIFVPNVAFRGEPRLLILSFLCGAAAYGIRDKIPSSIWLAMLSAVASYLLLSIRNPLTFLAPIPIAYLTCWLGTRNPKKSVAVSSGDYSYGIYLYAFPFQQIYVHFAIHPVWYWNVAFSIPVTIIFAIISWHLIERPFLKLRQSAVIAKFVGGGLRKSPHANRLAEEPPAVALAIESIPPVAENETPSPAA